MAPRIGISVSQFAEQLYRAWMAPRGVTYTVDRSASKHDLVTLPWKIGMITLHLDRSKLIGSGLAISGGADSMALAYLCKQLEQMSDSGVVSFTAFVVDHRARPESSQEANMVAGWLRDMGMFFIEFSMVSLPRLTLLRYQNKYS